MLIIFTRFYYLQMFLSLVALLHLGAEWLYLGRLVRRGWTLLLVLLLCFGVLGGFWICPKLKQLHAAQHVPHASAVEQEAGKRRYDAWHGVLQAMNVLTILGVGGFMWRLTRVQDEPRFVMPFQFRS